jgi:Methyltransferase domain
VDQVKTYLIRALEAALARLRPAPPQTFFAPGHFHSPIVDPADPQVAKVCQAFASSEIPGGEDLAIDEDLILDTLQRIGAHYGKVAFPETKQDGFRYYYQNPMYSYGDAIVLSCMLMELRPKRLVEVGSGYSSCAAMDTSDRLLDSSVEFTFIEPYPARLLSLLDHGDRYRKNIVATPLQDAPIETFSRLEPNDILFVDSSHVAKIGSDVNDCLFRILPALKPGVVIHFHDIFYPFEYPPTWIADVKLSWNEAYLLHAFLQYNDRYRILYFNHLAELRFRGVLEERMPLCLRNCGGGIWVQKV